MGHTVSSVSGKSGCHRFGYSITRGKKVSVERWTKQGSRHLREYQLVGKVDIWVSLGGGGER